MRSINEPFKFEFFLIYLFIFLCTLDCAFRRVYFPSFGYSDVNFVSFAHEFRYEDPNDSALSVEGQVRLLIAQATAEENLHKIYFGWAPWL